VNSASCKVTCKDCILTWPYTSNPAWFWDLPVSQAKVTNWGCHIHKAKQCDCSICWNKLIRPFWFYTHGVWLQSHSQSLGSLISITTEFTVSSFLLYLHTQSSHGTWPFNIGTLTSAPVPSLTLTDASLSSVECGWKVTCQHCHFSALICTKRHREGSAVRPMGCTKVDVPCSLLVLLWLWAGVFMSVAITMLNQ